jgi:DNA-binding NarL/FixJ family response regulator
LAGKLKPDIAILDVTMPLLGGLEATRRILKHLPRCEVLILTMHESEQLMREVLIAGAKGYVRKADAGQLVVAAVESLSRHKPFFSSEVSSLLLDSYLKDEHGGPLTERESEIVKLIAEGRSSKEIAADLGLSPHTVETHRLNLMRKLDVHSLSEIVRYAIRNGMIQA